MKCETCGRALVERVSDTERPYHYTLSGLCNVFLIGVEVVECKECGYEEPTIPAVGELHRQLALNIIRTQSSLAGEEIRYLRTYAGLTAREFAAMIPIDHTHLSKAENGHLALGAAADTALRAAALWKIKERLQENIFRKDKEALRRKAARKRAHERRNCTPKGKGWEVKAA